MTKLVTFDCYATLINTAPLYGSVGDIGPTIGIDKQVLTNAFVSFEDRLMYGESFLRYDKLVYRALEYCELDLNCSGLVSEYDRIMEIHKTMKPFDEVPETLRRLKERGYKTAILANNMTELMAYHIKEMRHEFDYVILAEQTHCYKPTLDFFIQAAEMIDLRDKEHCHVAAGYWWDIIPASKLGWNKIWVNRRGKRGSSRHHPYHEVAGLDQILQYLP